MCLLFNEKLSQYAEGVLTAHTVRLVGHLMEHGVGVFRLWTHTYVLHACLCEI